MQFLSIPTQNDFLLPVDASDFICSLLVGEEGAFSKCSTKSDAFMSAGQLAFKLLVPIWK